MPAPVYTNSALVLQHAACALSPAYAYAHTATMRKLWPTMFRDPDEICRHFACNHWVKSLIWC